jgi:hypothetical protein
VRTGPLEAGQPSDLPEDRVVAATPTVSLSSMKPVRQKGSAQDESLGNRESDHLVDSLGFGG